MDTGSLAILTLVAIAVSPVIAVLVTVYLQNRKETRGQKLVLLGTLIGNRPNQTSDENIRALNLIDVVFHDAPRVRELWHEYFGMLNNAGLQNPLGIAQREKKNLEMITEMAKALGYGKAITHLDVDRVYFPIALGERWQRDKAISDAALKFLEQVGGLIAASQQTAVPPAQTVGASRVAPAPESPPKLPGA